MKFRPLGDTDINVSELCLGTMTWGEQNTESEAHAQLDMALHSGINFIDTAEMYPVPPKAETQGRTESYIGNWLSRRGERENIVLATKVAGPSEWMSYIREGGPKLNRSNIHQALESSLKRLKTDYVDLYQIHWPARATNFFGTLGYTHTDNQSDEILLESLTALSELIQQGKIRQIGISNETPWGTMKYLELSKAHDLPRIVSIQNPYSLLNRSFEVGGAEVAHREKVGLLAYSPLAFGVLSGKYLGGKKPENARLTLFDRFTRYLGEHAEKATQEYWEIAQSYGVSLTQLALAYVSSRPFVTSNIIGATNLAQLQENIDSIQVILSEEITNKIEKIHKIFTYPCP